MLLSPLPVEEARSVELVKGPNIASLPELDALPDELELPILLKVGNNMSTDEIMPAGARVLPYRSNIPKISEFVYDIVDPDYAEKALELKPQGGHAIIGGENYGQGSSREHAALAPRYLGLRLVIAKSFARIHRKNLVNYGILPLVFDDDSAYDKIKKGDVITLTGLRQQLAENKGLEVKIQEEHLTIATSHNLSAHMIEVLLAGGLTNWVAKINREERKERED
jgi:aconitate hydratase